MSDSKIFIIAHLPKGLTQEWLQHVRDFDIKHPDCHFEVAIDTPEKSLMEAIEELKVNPELTFSQIFERKRN